MSARPHDAVTHGGDAPRPATRASTGCAVSRSCWSCSTTRRTTDWRGTKLEAALTIVPSVGWSGVDLFFVLSGFLITGILLGARDGTSVLPRLLRAPRVAHLPALLRDAGVLPARGPAASRSSRRSTHFWNPGASREQFWYWLFLSNLQACAQRRVAAPDARHQLVAGDRRALLSDVAAGRAAHERATPVADLRRHDRRGVAAALGAGRGRRDRRSPSTR